MFSFPFYLYHLGPFTPAIIIFALSNLPTKMERHLSNFFTDHLPTQANCSGFSDAWPKSGICSNNAIDCLIPNSTHHDPTTFSCVCADGWTGEGDYISLGDKDCHIKESAVDVLFFIFGLVGLANVLIISLWCYRQFIEIFVALKAGKKPKPKSLSYLVWVFDESIVVVGMTYRLTTGRRVGFDAWSTTFNAMIIGFFMVAAYLFISTWVRMALASVSMETSKQETTERANKICRVLKYQMVCAHIIQTSCYIGVCFCEGEISLARELLTNTATVMSAIDALCCIACLWKCGKILTGAVANMGDESLKKMGTTFLRIIYAVSFMGITCAIAFLSMAFIPVLVSYQAYLMTFALIIGGSIPMAVVLLLENPAWLKDLQKCRKSKIVPDIKKATLPTVVSAGE